MPCKHEGGSDPCVRYPDGHCKVRQKQNWSNMVYRRVGKGTPCDRGQASEHFVACDLLSRGLLVTKPLNINGPHDLHAKCGKKWFTFQVKSGKVNRKTGTLRPNHTTGATSDIIVAVDIVGKRVRYLPRNISKLPPELCDAAF